MPTYGYECLDCGHSFETYQKITDDALTKCERCEGDLKKKIYPVGIAFKGSGFYVNDYANKSSTSTENSSKKSEAPAVATDKVESAAPVAFASATAAKSEPAATPSAPAVKPAS
jgi:putative FmdB family regulatory protein